MSISAEACHGAAVDLIDRPPAGTNPWDWYQAAWSRVPIMVVDPGSDRHATTRWAASLPAVIEMHYRLSDRQRGVALAHELHHLAIGGVCRSLCPQNERLVRSETAMWLLSDSAPILDLVAAGICTSMIAMRFGVTRSLIEDRLAAVSHPANTRATRSLRGDR